MKHRMLIAIGLGVYLLAIIGSAPATLIDASLQRISHGKLRLVEAQGTLWSGSGQLEMRDSHGQTGVVKSLAWQIQPGSLLRGSMVCNVELEQANKPFAVTISLSRIELANADISLPATALGLGVPKLAPLGLSGELLLHITSLSLEHNQMQSKATLQWREAGSAFTPISPLGDYELNFNANGTTIDVLLHTLQGPLQLDGQGSWTSGNNPVFLAIARVPVQHQQQLDPLLHLIAVERGTGNFELQLK